MGAKTALCLFVLGLVAACGPAGAPSTKSAGSQSSTSSSSAPAVLTVTSATTPQPTAPSTAAPTATPSARPTLAPIDVQVKVDDRLSASAVISSTGGTLRVESEDGTRYTLTVPQNALVEDTNITLLPLTAVDRLPFSGGLAGGVQMLPEGLRLYQPATLTIESTRFSPVQGFQVVAFGYHQNGQGLYLTPSDMKGQVVTIPVWHFSGAGAASGTAEEIKIQQQRVLADAEDALSQRISEYLLQERELQQLGLEPDPKFKENMVGYLREAFQLLRPQLAIAVQDCEASKTILPKALMWARQVELLGYGDEFRVEVAQVMQAFGDAIVNCYSKAYDKCVKEHDLNQIAVMLGLLRQATLLSPAEGGGLAARLDESKIDKCGTFELTLNASVNITASDPAQDVKWSYRAHAVVPGVRLSIATTARPASGPLILSADTPSHSSKVQLLSWTCVFAGPPTGSGTLSVPSLTIGAAAEQRPSALKISLLLDPSIIQENLPQVTCTLSDTGSETADFFTNPTNFSSAFNVLHRQEQYQQGYLISDWQLGNRSLFAQKNYNRTVTNSMGPVQMVYSEDTTLELAHKPQ